MFYKILPAILIFLFDVVASYSEQIILCPISTGNTWNYKYVRTAGCFYYSQRPVDSLFRTFTILDTVSVLDSIRLVYTRRDSGTSLNYSQDSNRYISRQIDSTTMDTIVFSKNDSILFECLEFNEGCPTPYKGPFYPLFDFYKVNTMACSTVIYFDDSLLYFKISEGGIASSSRIYLQNYGMFSCAFSASVGGCGEYYHIQLNSFNGKSTTAPLSLDKYQSLLLGKNTDPIVSPNPSNGFIKIDFQNLSTITMAITLLDIRGKIVMKWQNQTHNSSFNLPKHLHQGLYVLKISTISKTYYSRILIQ